MVYGYICKHSGVTVDELSSTLKVDEDSVKMHIEELERMGLVKITGEKIYPVEWRNILENQS